MLDYELSFGLIKGLIEMLVKRVCWISLPVLHYNLAPRSHHHDTKPMANQP